MDTVRRKTKSKKLTVRRKQFSLQLLGKLPVIFLEYVTDIEEIAFGFACFGLDADIVEIGFYVLLTLRYSVLEVYDVVFVAWIYHIPRIFSVGAGSGGYYGLEEMVEAVLPAGGAVVLSAVAQREYQVIHLGEVERIVGENCLGEVDYRVEFLTCVLASEVVVKRFFVFRTFCVAVRVIILLEHHSEIQVAVLVEIHHGFVLLVKRHQLRIIVGRRGIEHILADLLHIRLFHYYFLLGFGCGEGAYEN